MKTTTSRELRKSYYVDLKSGQWEEFRDYQIAKSDGKCWNCNSRKQLQVHHLTYRDVKPWEYEDDEVRVLCDECHALVHLVADEIWVQLLRFEVHELEAFLKRLKTCKERGDLVLLVNPRKQDAVNPVNQHDIPT